MAMARKPESVWGYIEGYYGRLFGWPERRAMIGHLAAGRAGSGAVASYLYAPKEDPLHRRDWRKPYPAAWRARFGELGLGRRPGQRPPVPTSEGVEPRVLQRNDPPDLIQ